ncbi:MAG TPA: hypothetical protein VNF74_09150 [Terriglobales bacterium]|nr:hypothetical protein [Terriglobales bacterium]
MLLALIVSRTRTDWIAAAAVNSELKFEHSVSTAMAGSEFRRVLGTDIFGRPVGPRVPGRNEVLAIALLRPGSLRDQVNFLIALGRLRAGVDHIVPFAYCGFAGCAHNVRELGLGEALPVLAASEFGALQGLKDADGSGRLLLLRPGSPWAGWGPRWRAAGATPAAVATDIARGSK